MCCRPGCSSPFPGHWAHRWIYHWVCDTWPVRRQTFPAIELHRSLARTMLYCLVTEAHVCEQIAEGHYRKVERPAVIKINFSGRERRWQSEKLDNNCQWIETMTKITETSMKIQAFSSTCNHCFFIRQYSRFWQFVSCAFSPSTSVDCCPLLNFITAILIEIFYHL